MLDILKGAAIGVALTLTLGTTYHLVHEHGAVKAAVTQVENKYKDLMVQESIKAKAKEDTLQASADTLRESKDETINRINTSLTAALSELRKRPKRPPDTAPPTSVGEACTARELYYEDAEFLTREAARAESVLVERDYYYNQYEEVRKLLNGSEQRKDAGHDGSSSDTKPIP